MLAIGSSPLDLSKAEVRYIFTYGETNSVFVM